MLFIAGVSFAPSEVTMKWGGMLSVENATLFPFFAILGQMTMLQAAKTESLGRGKFLSFANGPFHELWTCVQVLSLLAEEARLDDSCKSLLVLIGAFVPVA